MTIGNFFDAAHTTTIPLNPNASYAWYLIDDVYVGIDSAVSVPSVNFHSSDTAFCNNQCVDFFDQSTNNPTSWQWFFPGSDSSTSNLQNPANICYNNYGSFDVTLVACNNIGCDTLILNNFIYEFAPPAAPLVTYSNDTLFSSQGIEFQWYELDSGIINGAENQYFVPAFDGQYYVTITDSNGCSASSDFVTITDIRNQTGVEEKFSCYPNPGNGSFTINFNEQFTGKDFQFIVSDIFGKTIYLSGLTQAGAKHSYNLQLNDGIYIVMANSCGIFFPTKLIVNKNIEH